MENNSNVEDFFDDRPVEEKKVSTFDEKNYLNTKLSKGETKREMTIRILLTKNNEGKLKFAIPVDVHTMTVNKEVADSGFKTFICADDQNYPNHDERGCPLCKRVDELFEEANKFEKGSPERKTLCREAFKLKDTKKLAYVVRCIERGKEDEGVKFWRFNSWANGNGNYDKIRGLAEQRNRESLEAGRGRLNIFDYEDGYDLILTITKSEKSSEKGVEKTEINITDAKFPSKLSNDPEQAKAWIEDTKDWRDMYKVKPHEYLQVIADGGVPVWDSAAGHYVAKVENNIVPNDTDDLEGQKILSDTTPVVKEQAGEEELPF